MIDRRCRAVLLQVALGLALSIYPRAFAIADEIPEYRSMATGAPLAPADIERALTNGVLVRLAGASTVAFLDLRVASAGPAVFYIGASSSFVFAASLSGSIESGKAAATPGHVIIWDFVGNAPQVREFNVARFIASSPVAADPTVQAALTAAAARQKRLMFWGLLEPASLNLQAPANPSVEFASREYLLTPTVARLRRETGAATETMPRRVAERFVAALAARDPEAVAALLHPDLFQRSDQAGGDWLALRAAYAKSLTAGPLPPRLQGATLSPGADGAHWQVSAGSTTYTLSLAARDDMSFVTALEGKPPAVALDDRR